MKKLINYFVPTECKDKLERTRALADVVMEKSRAEKEELCNSILCLFGKYKDKITHEISTPNDYRPTAITKLQAK